MSEIKPALTADEWARKECVRDHYGVGLGSFCTTSQIVRLVDSEAQPAPGEPVGPTPCLAFYDGNGDGDDGRDFGVCGGLHAIAALALYDQPFGFTWEDVDLNRATYQNYVILARKAQDDGDEAGRLGLIELARRHYELSSRIAALLPPRVS